MSLGALYFGKFPLKWGFIDRPYPPAPVASPKVLWYQNDGGLISLERTPTDSEIHLRGQDLFAWPGITLANYIFRSRESMLHLSRHWTTCYDLQIWIECIYLEACACFLEWQSWTPDNTPCWDLRRGFLSPKRRWPKMYKTLSYPTRRFVFDSYSVNYLVSPKSTKSTSQG